MHGDLAWGGRGAEASDQQDAQKNVVELDPGDDVPQARIAIGNLSIPSAERNSAHGRES